MEKLIDNATFFLLFLQYPTKFGPNFTPKITPILICLPDSHLNMFEDSSKSNNLCCYVLVLKKKKRVKPLILLVLDPNWEKQGVRMGHTQNENQCFFSEMI